MSCSSLPWHPRKAKHNGSCGQCLVMSDLQASNLLQASICGLCKTHRHHLLFLKPFFFFRRILPRVVCSISCLILLFLRAKACPAVGHLSKVSSMRGAMIQPYVSEVRFCKRMSCTHIPSLWTRRLTVWQ